MNKLSVDIGQRIRNYRIHKNMSQEELAEKCGLHPTYIGQVERGEKNATIESISKIVDGLNISLSTLFEHIDIHDTNDKENYPLTAYNLVQSVPEAVQDKLITIIKSAISMRD